MTAAITSRSSQIAIRCRCGQSKDRRFKFCDSCRLKNKTAGEIASRKKRNHMTPKEIVLKANPGAWLWLQPQELYVVMPRKYLNANDALGCGETAREAWADAANGIQ